MVFVKVREVYDLHTVQNKMTVIGIHTPKPDIIKANFPGLLMQCKAYRPYLCDVRVACASQQALDPLGVGTTEGDVAPEDLFNPILYKACTNLGMSQLEARINSLSLGEVGADVSGPSAIVDVDTLTAGADEFPIYYGLLANAHGWRTADPQAGLEMKGLRPLVYEQLVTIPDMKRLDNGGVGVPGYPADTGSMGAGPAGQVLRGNAKPLPFINCTSYSATGSSGVIDTGFQVGSGSGATRIQNAEVDVNWVNCLCAAIIVPPSRLHELFYRMVVEWTLEFTAVRPIGEIANWTGLGALANLTHYQSYSYESTKQVLGVEGEIMDHDQTMVSANVEVKKVM